MPYLYIQTNCRLQPEQKSQLSQKASSAIAKQLGKAEQYVMVAIDSDQTMWFAGSDKPTAYLELKSIGLPETLTPDLSQTLCSLINDELAITADRIYIEFANAERHMWGWNNKTF